jgi:L-fuculose-phosphate aldolase
MDAIREAVCSGARRLLEEGLAERTWGNISVRCDSKSFAITPSGRAYSTLKADDIVIVSLAGLSFEGAIKPSSEKGLHREIYAARADVNAIIHTHQLYASIVSALSGAEIDVKIAARALAGTKELALSAASSLGMGSSVLLANHGAVCAAASIGEAFEEALKLESLCRRYIEEKVSARVGASGMDAVREFYLASFKNM